MKRSITIIAFLISIKVFGGDSIPENNKVVLNYGLSKIGQTIGSGICFDLVDSALIQVNPHWKEEIRNGEHVVYGKKISSKKIKAGDIILLPNHVAIVYKIDDNGIYLIEQGAISGLNVVSKTGHPLEIKEDAVFYRPY